ncbi:histidine--tRNA ligase [Candidatus Woesearchaeota archaeon]|nr:histidine--tRNA ligase [Candidatus Woesearchaeota archaeon]MCF7901210.1 histidine--tRNA ligase [Candidatus Woesearchaeota archaeon]MCF8013695.1 histidine--tRNA ligase [Candidatus Woesearchaeota archaeon]
MEMMLAKGVKDTSPEEKILKNKIMNAIVKNFELNGYNPLQTPTIERFDVLSSKYAGGAEILKETFKFNDQGDRELCLRYDLTVPFARYISMNPTIKMPFKRYQVGQVFRDGPIKLGRLREFTQCDADVVGIKDMFAEAELLGIAQAVFTELKLNTYTEVNNRKILDAIVEESGVSKEKVQDIILTIDKMKKISKEDIYKELKEKGIDEKNANKIFTLIETKETNEETLKFLQEKINSEKGKEGLKEMKELLDYVNKLGVKIIFDPSLARGLTYYTGTVFEVYLEKSKIRSSIGAGGRYDNMIKDFINNNQEYPAVGFSFGIDVIFTAMKQEQKELEKTVVKAFIIPIGNNKDAAIKTLTELRKQKINCEMNIAKKSISKALDYASSYNIPFCILIGDDEAKEGKVKLKNMLTGEEKTIENKNLKKEIIQ